MRLRHLAEWTGWTLIIAGLWLVFPNGTAQAYLDPGSGSFIIQVLIAALAGAVLTLRVFWDRIIGFFRRSDVPSTEESDSSAAASDD
jgi:hypothetical protein